MASAEVPSAALDVNGTAFLLPAPSSAIADASIANSQWSLWLDEGNDEFELKAKKSDGSIISQTVSGGGSDNLGSGGSTAGTLYTTDGNVGRDAGDKLTFVDNTRIEFDVNGSEQMRLTNAGQLGIGVTPTAGIELDVNGDIEYTGTITDTSDRRLKDNITALDVRGSMIEKIAAIDTYSFTMKDDEEKRIEFGVMAQELEEIFPELVHTATDEMGTKSVNYMGLIAPMIEATKEVHAENQMLRSELANIKAQVDLLNKATAGNADKASMMPTNANPWLYVLLGMLSTLCISLILNRKIRE